MTNVRDPAALLARVERSNSFLVSLDDRREWYRYHHLFGGLLRHLLLRNEPDLVPALHARAASWLLQHGFVSEGYEHALSAGDFDRAADVIAEHWLPVLSAGDRGVVRAWLDRLPCDVVRDDARLCLARAWVCLVDAAFDELLEWSDAAARAPRSAPTVQAEVATPRASRWLRAGDPERTAEYASEALGLEQEPHFKAIAAVCLGTSCYWRGDGNTAAEFWHETMRLGRSQQPLVVIFALGYLALLAVDSNDLQSATAHVQSAVGLIAEFGVEEYWMASVVRLANGRLLEAERRLSDAEEELQRAVALARRGAAPLEHASALAALASVRAGLGDANGARVLVGDALAALELVSQPGPRILAVITEVERRLHVRARRSSRHGPADDLSDREFAVLRLLATTLTQREMARELDVTFNTVKSHVRNLFRKLDVSSRREAVARARELKLL